MQKFGVFEFDVGAGELRRKGLRVHLQEQPFRVLEALLEHPGELVSRDALRGRLWPDGVYLDYERGLNKAVQKLRQALGDSSDSPQFIETVPRRGYRFIAGVESTSSRPPLSASVGLRATPGFPRWLGTSLAAALVGVLWLLAPSPPARVGVADTVSSRLVGTTNAAAYDAYLRGRVLFERRSPDALRRAVDEFRLAARLDPDFAQAYAGEVQAFGPLVTLGFAPALDVLPALRESADRALALGPHLAEAHTAVALVRSLEWNWPAEERAYRRAIAFDPTYVTAYLWYAFLLESLGRPAEALALRRQAADLDPLNLAVRTNLASALFHAGDSSAALNEFEATLTIDPLFPLAHSNLGAVLWALGRRSEALAELERSDDRGGLGHALAVAGEPMRARTVLTDLRRKSAAEYVSPLDMAAVHAGLGERDEAFEWLEQAYAERTPWLMRLNVDWRLAPLRTDPRFAALVRRVGLPPRSP